MLETVTDILAATWAMTTEMAPYLLLGFGVAGLLSAFVSAEWVERHLGRRTTGQVVKASLFGVPLPLCSCGVLPVAASLHRHGASRGSTTSFLISTPQTGVDSIAVTWALLGPVVAVIRPVAAFVTGIAGGLLVSATDDHPEQPVTAPPEASCGDTDCCGPDPSGSRFVRAIRYGFLILPRDIGRALTAGLLISGVLAAFLEPGALESVLGGGVGAYLAAILVGVPLYVCATASTPIAASLVAAGLSPGAALAFLITGPATNTAAIATLLKVLGRRAVVLYLVTVAVGAVLTGVAVDTVLGADLVGIPVMDVAGVHDAHHDHDTAWAWIGDVSGVALIGVLVFALWPWRRSGASEEDSMDEDRGVELAVGGMRCNGCVDSVSRALREVSGVSEVRVDLNSGRTWVHGRGLEIDQLCRVVGELGFECEPAG